MSAIKNRKHPVNRLSALAHPRALGVVVVSLSAFDLARAAEPAREEPEVMQGVRVQEEVVEEGYKADASSSPKFTAPLLDTPQTITVIKKELRQTARDRRMLFLLIAVPVIQLFIFANAVNLDVDRVPTVVVDLDKSQRSLSDLRRLLADGTLTKIGELSSVPEAERWIETGRAAVVLLIPEGFERDMGRLVRFPGGGA